MKKLHMEEVSKYDLPPELVETIVSKLPAKPLIRFLTTSKKWYDLVTGTHFVSSHLKITNSRIHKTHFLLDFMRRRTYLLYSDDAAAGDDDDDSFNGTVIRLPLQGFGVEVTRDLIVAGCCNGLISLTDCDQVVILWNPAIQRAVRLPVSNIDPRDETITRFAFGLVFDHVSSDFKVLRTTHPWDGDVVVEMYRLSTNAWERWTKGIPFEGMWGYQVVLNGVAHWIGLNSEAKLMIVTFDVHREVFGSIEVPATLAEDDETVWADYPACLFLFQESLVLIHYENEYDQNIGKSRTRYDFWKMEEYGKGESWKKWRSIHCYDNRNPLGFRKNGEILWDEIERKEFISSNLENFSERCIGRYEARKIQSCLNYAESLALLDTTMTRNWDSDSGQQLLE